VDMHPLYLAGIKGISQVLVVTHSPAECALLRPHTAPLVSRNKQVTLVTRMQYEVSPSNLAHKYVKSS